ncbi:MAG: RIP metalloprotease RseP [Planctomycetota bacterium]
MSHLMLAAGAFGVIMTVVGLGALIFVHELGHFLACRVTGTRVEAFSIGFGPKIFGWRRGGTEFKLSAIPLGGYVKMAAENPDEPGTGAPDEFPQKSYSQKLLIMVAGVAFNALLAFLLFAWAFGLGVKFPQPIVGSVDHGGAAWEAGLQRGDTIRSMGGHSIMSFEDLSMEVALSAEDEALELIYERDGETRTTLISPQYSEAQGLPTIGVRPSFNDRAGAVTEGSPIAKAGGRVGDRIVAVDGEPTPELADADRLVARRASLAAPGTKEIEVTLRVEREDGTQEDLACTLPISMDLPQVGIVPYHGRQVTHVQGKSKAAGLLRAQDVILQIDGEPLLDFQVFRDEARGKRTIRSIRVRRDGQEIDLAPATPMTDRDLAESISVGAWDGTDARISPRTGMPAASAGVRAGDIVQQVGDEAVSTWLELQSAIRDAGADPVALRVKRAGGEVETIVVKPIGRTSLGQVGYEFELVMHVVQETGFFAALGLGWERTTRSFRQVVLTLRNLLTARVSAKHVGGPVGIVQITYNVFSLGWSRYLLLLALLSMNLAVLNLLPIPILDGGQIVLLTIEKIRGKPLPDRVVGYLQLVGLVLILSLIVLATTNDITRNFR